MPRRIVHGFTRNGRPAPEWLAWKSMRVRCLNPNFKSFRYYGGRGIKVCKRWLESFENFYADMGPRPSDKHSLDRYPDKDGDYEPGNCRWATPEEQVNNRRITPFLECDGHNLCLSDWVAKLGIRRDTIVARLRRGWTVRQALEFDPRPPIVRRLIAFRGESRSMKEWSKITGIPEEIIEGRLNKLGWSVEQTLSIPKLSNWSRHETLRNAQPTGG